MRPASEPSNLRCTVAVLALMALALALRFLTLDFGLPYSQEPDPHILDQIALLSQPVVDDRTIFFSSIYPHLLARLAIWTGAPVALPENLAALDLAGQLEVASRMHHHVRALIACLSVLMIPATFWLASWFLSRRWSLAAAALAAASTLSLQFGQQARPHAATAPLIVIAVAACIGLRRHGTLRWFLIAGAACALAIASLTNALAVMIPAFVAFLLRNGARRRILDARVLLSLGLVALAIRLAYPFFFVETPPEAVMPTEEGTVSFGWQTFNWSEFQGAGFPTLFLTLWFYEPVASLLALAGLVAWLVRRNDRSAEWSERRKDLLVALSFALSYALVIGLQVRNQQRFALPLLPFVFVAAAYGLAALWRADRLKPLAYVGSAACVVPVLACLGFVGMRLRPHTLEQLGMWIEANVRRGEQRVAIHLLWDVPLAREHANLFDAQGNVRKVTLSPWLLYQAQTMDALWMGERWDIEQLYPERERWGAILKAPGAYLDELGADFVALPAGEGVGVTALTRALRAELVQRGAKVVLELPAEERPPPSGREGLDTSHFTLYVLTSHWFGPQLEVYALPAR
ncbi:MAG: glycosyltransferase family 39 protein [Planctomycetota bacterium]|nr:glycosyltransferase family 39 protein [Planctomycetota bacterium]